LESVTLSFVKMLPQLAYQAWKMRNAAYGLILSVPIVDYFQIQRIMASNGNIYRNDVTLDVDRCHRPL